MKTKTNRLWAALLAVGVLVSTLNAATLNAATTETHHGVFVPNAAPEAGHPQDGRLQGLFRAGEVQLDLAGLYTAAQPRGIEKMFQTNARHGPFGIGAGVTYFPSLYLGVGTEIACYDLRDPGPILIDSVAVNAILRVPLGRVAPNLTVGVGRDFDGGRYFFQGGPGFEVRVNRGIALFADAKFQFKEQAGGDQLLARAGVRFVF